MGVTQEKHFLYPDLHLAIVLLEINVRNHFFPKWTQDIMKQEGDVGRLSLYTLAKEQINKNNE